MLTKTRRPGKSRLRPPSFPGALPANIRLIQEVAPPPVEMARGEFRSCKNLPIPMAACPCGDLNHGYQTVTHLCGCVVPLETFGPMTRRDEQFWEGRHCNACYSGSSTAEHDRRVVDQIWPREPKPEPSPIQTLREENERLRAELAAERARNGALRGEAVLG